MLSSLPQKHTAATQRPDVGKSKRRDKEHVEGCKPEDANAESDIGADEGDGTWENSQGYLRRQAMKLGGSDSTSAPSSRVSLPPITSITASPPRHLDTVGVASGSKETLVATELDELEDENDETRNYPSSSSPPAALPLGTNSTKRRYIQTILDTTSAAWNRKVHGAAGVEQGQGEPPLKKICGDSEEGRGCENNVEKEKVGTKSSGKETRSVQQSLRVHLSGFARGGSRVVDNQGDADMEDAEVEESGDDGEPHAGNGRGGEARARRESVEGVNGRRKTTISAEEKEAEPSDDLKDHNAEVYELPDDTEMDVNSNHDSDSAIHSAETAALDLVGQAGNNPSLDKGADMDSHDIAHRPEIMRTTGGGQVSLRFDLSRISDTWRRLGERVMAGSSRAVEADAVQAKDKVPIEAGVSNTDDDDKATDALARVIDKHDFEAMEVVGQFNHGFIVARRRAPITAVGNDGEDGEMDDLFIVDQHAADEKYNFETLQQTTSIRSQRLFRCGFCGYQKGLPSVIHSFKIFFSGLNHLS